MSIASIQRQIAREGLERIGFKNSPVHLSERPYIFKIKKPSRRDIHRASVKPNQIPSREVQAGEKE